MAIGSVSPVAVQQFFDANGDPLTAGKLGFYLAGTDTPTPAYSDYPLTVPLPNPVILDAAGRAPQLFLGALAYKQVLQDAAGVTIWTADNLVTPTALRSVQGATSLTGTQDNVPVPAGVISFLQFDNATPLTVTGFAGGTPGQLLILRAGQLAPVYLVNWSSSTSAAGNTLINFVSSGPTALAGPKGTAVYVYGTFSGQGHWLLLTHEQGQAIRVPYLAGNFFPSLGGGAMAWTVEAADVLSHDYLLSGSAVTYTVQLRNTTVADAPQYLLAGGLPYTARVDVAVPAISQYGAGTFESVVLSPRATFRDVAFARAALGTWAAGTNTVHVFGQVSVDVV